MRPPPPLPMDPRIRQRRIEVRRHEGRRRFRALLACVAVVLTLAGAAALARSPVFDVDYVDVRGNDRTPRGEIVAAGRLADHPAMLDVDTGDVERRVEALPWVLEARAALDWPGTVHVSVTERAPVAVLPAGDGRWAMADVTGRVLAVGPDKPVRLPVVGDVPPPGAPGTVVAARARPALRVAEALSPALRDRVADLAIVAGGDVELQLVPPGGVVRLGRPVDLDRKLAVLGTVLARADLTNVAVIDVRVPRAPSLTRR